VTPPTMTWAAGSTDPMPPDLTAVLWPNGMIECRFRLLHPAGSLVSVDGEVGLVLTAPGLGCTMCSDACTD
jgi:hypothetical protein